jgi:circadian clock protein KaiC
LHPAIEQRSDEDMKYIRGFRIGFKEGSVPETSNAGQSETAKIKMTERRLESGVMRLDYILKGGFIKGSIYSVVGPPGSGKTVYGNQICYNHARNQGRSVYISILVESTTKMLGHIESFDFFQPELVNNQIFYFSAYGVYKAEGLRGLLTLIRNALREHKAELLVIDGLESRDPGYAAIREFQEFIHELQGVTALMGCTTFLLSPISRSASMPQNPLVDGIMEFSRELLGPRSVHEVIIHKFRGSDFLQGKHELEITSAGLQIHPRTEVQFADPPPQATEERIRMGFGIPEFDRMLFGGLLSGTCNILLGAPGTGKTILGLHFLVEGARQGQSGIYFGFYEPPPRLIEKAERLGLELKKWVDQGLIELIWQPPLEHYIDALAEQLLEKLRNEAHTKSRRRLFIDGMEGFRNANVYPDRAPRFLFAFSNQLRALDVTSLITEELPLFKPELEMPNPELGNVVEGVILLRYVEMRSQIYRLISIMKMRESEHDTTIREFKITGHGVELAGPFAATESVLTGQGRMLSQEQPSARQKSPQKARKSSSKKKAAGKKGRKGGQR